MSKKMTKTIKKALIDQGKSVTDIANELGKSRVHISRVINDYFKHPPMGTLKLIAENLGIPFEDLVDDDRKRAA